MLNIHVVTIYKPLIVPPLCNTVGELKGYFFLSVCEQQMP